MKNPLSLHSTQGSPLQRSIISIAIILIMNLWSFLPYLQSEWSITYFPRFLFVLFGTIIFLTGKNYRITSIDRMAIWTIMTLILSSVPAYIDYHQSFLSSFSIISYSFYGFLLYFVVRGWNISEKCILKILGRISIVWVILEIGQQFTYPSFWFSGRYLLNYEIENRMGLWRFYIWGIDFVMIAFSIYYGKIVYEYSLNKKRITNILITSFLLLGILCYGSRKHIYCVLIVIAYSFFNVSNNKKWSFGFILLLFFLYLYTEFYSSFVEMNETISANQGVGEDFVRVLEAKYFLFDFSNSPLYPIFGSGVNGATGSLATKINFIQDTYGFYQADCGIIGYYSRTGLVGVSAVVYYIYIVLKEWRYIDLGYRYFFIMKMVLLFFDFWAMWNVGMAAYAIFIYLLNKNILKNKLSDVKRYKIHEIR